MGGAGFKSMTQGFGVWGSRGLKASGFEFSRSMMENFGMLGI